MYLFEDKAISRDVINERRFVLRHNVATIHHGDIMAASTSVLAVVVATSNQSEPSRQLVDTVNWILSRNILWRFFSFFLFFMYEYLLVLT